MDILLDLRSMFAVLMVAIATGCQPIQPVPIGGQQAFLAAQPGAAAPGLNPLFVPVTNAEWAWEQIAEVVNDYFRIERERQVQLVGQVMTEGRIDTFPQIGATVFEPHRFDSVGQYNEWESTFQTIRRRAVLRVIPEQGGYLIDVEVQKELEDLPRPEHATAGAATFRNDNSLPSRLGERVSPTRLSREWLPLGRDSALEQQILADIHARLGAATAQAPLLR